MPDLVLFIAAVEREMAPLRRRLAAEAVSFSSEALLTGVGKASAAAAAAVGLREWSPSILVQVGCAGAFRESGLVVGDVVVSNLEILADDGVEAPEGFLSLERLQLPAAHEGLRPIYNEVPVGRPRFETWQAVLARVRGRFNVRSGRTVTVSTGSGTEARAREIQSRWDAIAESMEGAAAAIAAIRHGCTFLEVRGISNITGNRDPAAWDVDAACEHAAEVAVCVVDEEIQSRHGNGI